MKIVSVFYPGRVYGEYVKHLASVNPNESPIDLMSFMSRMSVGDEIVVGDTTYKGICKDRSAFIKEGRELKYAPHGNVKKFNRRFAAAMCMMALFLNIPSVDTEIAGSDGNYYLKLSQ